MRVLIIDDVSVYRHALSVLLRSDGRTIAVDTAAHVDAALHRLGQAEPPDVVLLNMAMTDSIGVLRAVVRAARRIPVIALAASDDDYEVISCAEAGVSGYLHRSDCLTDLLELIDSVSRGETLCSPKVAGTLLRRVAALAGERQQRLLPPDLTPRQREVLHLLAEGLSNKQIARRLSIEIRTVKNHVHQVLQKCQASGRHEVAARVRAI